MHYYLILGCQVFCLGPHLRSEGSSISNERFQRCYVHTSPSCHMIGRIEKKITTIFSGAQFVNIDSVQIVPGCHGFWAVCVRGGCKSGAIKWFITEALQWMDIWKIGPCAEQAIRRHYSQDADSETTSALSMKETGSPWKFQPASGEISRSKPTAAINHRRDYIPCRRAVVDLGSSSASLATGAYRTLE